ncbi:MAG: hypothetical protein DMG36_16610, partial [Acidobacteria bacterium]
ESVIALQALLAVATICCAETVLVYHKELLQRYHEGSDNAELYEWVQSLTSNLPSSALSWFRRYVLAKFVC